MPAPIPPPLSPPPLRLPEVALPPYRFVPGLNPHPFRHPDGHLYTNGGPPPAPLWSADLPWQEDDPYLRGLDLFDHRYFWESHEVWEAIWRQVPREDPYGMLLQGLIQAGAFALKLHMGQPEAASRLLERATGRLLTVASTCGPAWRGLVLPESAERLQRFAEGGDWPVLARAL